MEYQTTTIQDGQLKIATSRTITQSKLSSECWIVQFQGLDACATCEQGKTRKTKKGISYSRECGGKNIRQTGRNEYGFSVPI